MISFWKTLARERSRYALGVVGFTGYAAVCSAACDVPLEPEPGEELSAGAFTVFEAGGNAFGHPVPGLSADDERAFFRGRALFRDDWVAAPASTQTRDGLGPLFNARSCIACHVADGRGRPPTAGERVLGPMLMRLGVVDQNGMTSPDPIYGTQLQPFGTPGVAGEGLVAVTYEDEPGTYIDGEAYALRTPRYSFEALGYGPLATEVRVSPRIPPAMIGLGLLAAIDDNTLEELADPYDRDGDGISGRVHEYPAASGRFGLKASQPTVRRQVAAAFNGDLGLTSATFPRDDCTMAQLGCREAISGGAPEVLAVIEDDVTAYSELLAVPARRGWADPAVLRGKGLFDAAGCAACHTPILETADGAPRFANTVLRPYTDLLLHDLGPALADDLPEPGASGTEWRTPPLWGLGLTEIVSGHVFLLHDGRARGFAEAILWHGGEAERSRDAFRALPEADRNDLLAFLASL